jgi:hypothetical protein
LPCFSSPNGFPSDRVGKPSLRKIADAGSCSHFANICGGIIEGVFQWHGMKLLVPLLIIFQDLAVAFFFVLIKVILNQTLMPVDVRRNGYAPCVMDFRWK